MAKKPVEKSSKSDRTRTQILAAAQHLFAERGYQHATIRDVAARAGIDPAMVIRYFRSKDELFARAATIHLKLPNLSGVERSAIGDTLIRHFLDLWEAPETGTGLAILLRSSVSNEFAARKMREVFAAQVGQTIARIGDPASAMRRAALVSSQLLGLALCRYILRLPPVVALTREAIVAEIGPTLQRYVTAEN